jgi:hypothetical protein
MMMPAIMPHLTAYAIGLVHHQSEPRVSVLTVLPFPLPPSRRARARKSSFIGDISCACACLCDMLQKMRRVGRGVRQVRARKPAMTRRTKGGGKLAPLRMAVPLKFRFAEGTKEPVVIIEMPEETSKKSYGRCIRMREGSFES